MNNLITKLRIDESSILFAKVETLEDKTVKKFSKSKYSKNIVLHNLYKEYVKNGGKINTLCSRRIFNSEGGHDGPMQFVHADVADLNFFSKSTVAPKYCLLCIDMFTQKLTLTA